MRKIQGFTLMEIILVVIIVGILFIAFIPVFSTKPKLEAQAQLLATDLRYIQHQAMSHSTSYIVNFTASTYAFSDLSGTAVVNPGANGSNTVTLPSDMSLSYDGNVLGAGLILFNQQGRPFVDATASSELVDIASIVVQSGSNQKTITVLPETGKVSVQ